MVVQNGGAKWWCKKVVQKGGAKWWCKKVVPKGGIEPPTQGFSVPCSTD